MSFYVLTPPTLQVNGVTASAAGMTLDLNDCVEKLRRADHHYDSFKRELWEFLNSYPYGALGEVEGEHGWYVFRVEVRRQAPPRLGLLLGEHIHQLRSALDHLIWQLAWWRLKKRPPETTVFPIKTSPRAFRRLRDRLDGRIPDDWLALIEALQPYDGYDYPLAVLERLWNRDKHQALVVVPITKTLEIGSFECLPNADAGTITERRPRSGVRLENGAELARVKISPTGRNPRVDMYDLFGVEVAVEDGGPSLATLEAAASLVRMLVRVFPGVPELPNPIPTFGGYMTSITTLPGANAARERGFTVLEPPPFWLER